MIGVIHSCNLHAIDQRLNFDAGTAVFNVGVTVTGAVSLATGKVKSITVSTGSWGAGTAAGYMVLSGVSGTFQNDEALAGSGTPVGAAVANGANADYVDSYGKRTQTASTTATSCRFVNLKAPAGNTEYGWSGRFPAVLLPSETTLSSPGDHAGALQQLTSTETGFSGTYEIQWPPIYYPTPEGGVHHITCALKAVT